MTHYHSLRKVIKAWYHLTDFDKLDTLFGLQFVWWSRIGSVLQFLAGLTIIAEIIGEARIERYKKRISSSVKLKKSFRVLKAAFRMRNHYLLMSLIALDTFKDKPRKDYSFLFPIFAFIVVLVFIYQSFKVLLFIILETFLSPITLYFYLSSKQRLVKLLSFFVLAIGFCMSLLFS